MTERLSELLHILGAIAWGFAEVICLLFAALLICFAVYGLYQKSKAGQEDV
ncbi:MAG TPA: hypothetical protein VEA59_06800 [Patescibacteria group bacterium]|nr:hypothetical protein [Patescibacteria group bacterium]